MKLRTWCETVNMTDQVFCIWVRMCLVLCFIFCGHGTLSEDARSRTRSNAKSTFPDPVTSPALSDPGLMIHAPTFPTPTITAPPSIAPSINTPSINIPSINIPSINTPSINDPPINTSHLSFEPTKSPHSPLNNLTTVTSKDTNIFSNTSIATLSCSTDLGEARSSTKLDSNSVSAAFIRGLYVFVGLSALITMYIAIKFIRLKRKRTHIRKYGLLANIDDVEMTPLDVDDEEDTTLFDTFHPGY